MPKKASKTKKKSAKKKPSKNGTRKNGKKNNKHPILKRKLTFGERASDKVTEYCGSWTFIFVMMGFVVVWMAINVTAYLNHWDPYPFILLNFVLSCISALQAPVILMSENRQVIRDRLMAKYDYKVNRRAEREILQMQKQLDRMERYIQRKLR